MAKLSPEVARLCDQACDLTAHITADVTDGGPVYNPHSRDVRAVVAGLEAVVVALHALTLQLAENAERTVDVEACIEDIHR